MGQFIDRTGHKYHRLTVLKRVPGKRKDMTYWLCRCDCGTEKVINANNLTRKTAPTQSCGCLWKERMQEVGRDPKRIAKYIKHGHARNTTNQRTSTYRSWEAMKRRCNNPKTHEYELYGGRGITYCDTWEDFENFLKDMGEKSMEGWCLHRIDKNKDYTPDNCEWMERGYHQSLHRKESLTYH